MTLHVSHILNLETFSCCQVHSLDFLLSPVLTCVLEHLIILLLAFLTDPACCDGSWNLVLLLLSKLDLVWIRVAVVDDEFRVD